MAEKHNNDVDCRIPYEEWCRRQIVMMFVENYKGDLTIEDLPKIENYCKSGVFENTEIVNELNEYIKLKSYFNGKEWRSPLTRLEDMKNICQKLFMINETIGRRTGVDIDYGKKNYYTDRDLSIFDILESEELYKKLVSDYNNYTNVAEEYRSKCLELADLKDKLDSVRSEINTINRNIVDQKKRLKNRTDVLDELTKSDKI